MADAKNEKKEQPVKMAGFKEVVDKKNGNSHFIKNDSISAIDDKGNKVLVYLSGGQTLLIHCDLADLG